MRRDQCFEMGGHDVKRISGENKKKGNGAILIFSVPVKDFHGNGVWFNQPRPIRPLEP